MEQLTDMAQVLANRNKLSESLRQDREGLLWCSRLCGHWIMRMSQSGAAWAGPGERENSGAQVIAILTSGSYWLNIGFTNWHKKTFSSSPKIKALQIKTAVRYHSHRAHGRGDVLPDPSSRRDLLPARQQCLQQTASSGVRPGHSERRAMCRPGHFSPVHGADGQHSLQSFPWGPRDSRRLRQACLAVRLLSPSHLPSSFFLS